MAHGEPINKPKKRKIKVVTYKRYIRTMVELATVHESKNHERWYEAMRIYAKNPTTKIVTPGWVWALFIAFACGVLTTIYVISI